ncbi:MAG: polyprenyl diphosphate synthase [Nanoarchaeota archaeon]
MKKNELEIEAFGRVQGVGFRLTVEAHAKKKGLTGFIFNRDIGSVIILVQGEKKKIEDFLVWLQTNPGFSRIDSLQYGWRANIKVYDDFRIIRKGNLISEQARNFYNLGKYILGKKIVKVPKHVSIIPDGNRRWAKRQGMHSEFGHYKAINVQHMLDIFHEAQNIGIKYLSFWGFSTENWKRNKIEVKMLFKLFFEFADLFRNSDLADKVRFKHIGRKDRLPSKLILELNKLEEETQNNSELTFLLCLDYGGRDEIVRAVNKMIKDGKKKISENDLNNYLDTAGVPDVDLIIRTSGECRTSGFMPFQAVYAELCFIQNDFPDFTADDLRKAVEWYNGRDRRFGGNSK